MARKRRSGGRRKGLSIGQVIVALPAIGGAVASAKGIWENYQFYKSSPAAPITAITGITVSTTGQVALDRNATMKALAPIVAGSIGSKLLSKVYAKVPAPMKRVLKVKVI